MAGPVLLDNTVLTNFALVGRPDVVMQLWEGAACATPAVMEEYRVGVSGRGLPTDSWRDLPILTLSDQETSFAGRLAGSLGVGERTSIAVALHRHGLFVSDDLDARNAARRLGIPTSGTVGILVSSVQAGNLSLDQADRLLVETIAAGYRSPITSLRPFLRTQEEPR